MGIAKKMVLSTQEGLDLLLKYLDIVRIPLPKSKGGTLKKNAAGNGQKQVESSVSSIWGNDEKSAYGVVDFDSSSLPVQSTDPSDSAPSTPTDISNPGFFSSSPLDSPAKSATKGPLAVSSAQSAPSYATSSWPHRSKTSSAFVSGLGSLGRSVGRRLKRSFGLKKAPGVAGEGSWTNVALVDASRRHSEDDDEELRLRRAFGNPPASPVAIRPIVSASDLILDTDVAVVEADLDPSSRHRRIPSAGDAADAAPMRRHFAEAAKTASLPPPASPANSATSMLERNRRLGVVNIRNPFSTLERPKKDKTSAAARKATLTASQVGDSGFLLAAKFCENKRHEYQNEMLQNYLHQVKQRFEEERGKSIGGPASVPGVHREQISGATTTSGTTEKLREGTLASTESTSSTKLSTSKVSNNTSVATSLESNALTCAAVTTEQSVAKNQDVLQRISDDGPEVLSLSPPSDSSAPCHRRQSSDERLAPKLGGPKTRRAEFKPTDSNSSSIQPTTNSKPPTSRPTTNLTNIHVTNSPDFSTTSVASQQLTSDIRPPTSTPAASRPPSHPNSTLNTRAPKQVTPKSSSKQLEARKSSPVRRQPSGHGGGAAATNNSRTSSPKQAGMTTSSETAKQVTSETSLLQRKK